MDRRTLQHCTTGQEGVDVLICQLGAGGGGGVVGGGGGETEEGVGHLGKIEKVSAADTFRPPMINALYSVFYHVYITYG